MTDKPDLTRVWASNAPIGNVVDPDTTVPGKVESGWEVEVPPFEHFNFIQQWFSQGLAHANEYGIMQWDSSTSYPVGALSRSKQNNEIYVAKTASVNKEPSTNPPDWETLSSYLVKDASETVKGIAEIATQSETNAGNDDTRFVTPLKLKNSIGSLVPYATTSSSGTVEIATQAEVDAGFDTQRMVSPSTLSNKIPFEKSGIQLPGNLANVVYTNTTGKPLQLGIIVRNISGGGALGAQLKVGGYTAINLSSPPIPCISTINMIVPPNKTYELSLSGTNWSLSSWNELIG